MLTVGRQILLERLPILAKYLNRREKRERLWHLILVLTKVVRLKFSKQPSVSGKHQKIAHPVES